MRGIGNRDGNRDIYVVMSLLQALFLTSAKLSPQTSWIACPIDKPAIDQGWRIRGTLRRCTFVAASGNCSVRVRVPILLDEGGYGRSLVGFDA